MPDSMERVLVMVFMLALLVWLLRAIFGGQDTGPEPLD